MTRQGKIFIIYLFVQLLSSATFIRKRPLLLIQFSDLGYLESNSIGPSKAMGGTGIAFLSEKSINMTNPASYSGLDSLLSIFEIAVFGKYTMFSTE